MGMFYEKVGKFAFLLFGDPRFGLICRNIFPAFENNRPSSSSTLHNRGRSRRETQ